MKSNNLQKNEKISNIFAEFLYNMVKTMQFHKKFPLTFIKSVYFIY